MTVIRTNAQATSLRRMFTTAYLLSGNLEFAETAVLEGIRLSQSGEMDDETVWHGVVSAALGMQRETVQPRAVSDRETALLPPELRPVLRLPAASRGAFVLRMLLRLPLEACGRLLGLSVEQLNEAVCVALQAMVQAAPAVPDEDSRMAA